MISIRHSGLAFGELGGVGIVVSENVADGITDDTRNNSWGILRKVRCIVERDCKMSVTLIPILDGENIEGRRYGFGIRGI